MLVIPAPNDVAFYIGNFPVYFYGITMATAIFAGILIANYLFNKINTPDKKDIILEYAPLFILFGILGARLYYCCLNPTYYFAHPIEILDIRKGGLSIHGSIIGGILSIIIVSIKTKISFFKLIDPLSCGIILGQAIGRWGNYFNSEAYGLPVASQNWGLFIPQSKRSTEFINYNLFHPTFLYESLLDLFIFFILLFIFFKFGKKNSGITCCIYLILYSLVRFFVEQLRVDSALNIGFFPVAQIVSICLCLTGIAGLTILAKKQK
ncbi:prolipoprotein diacylglyceryl transferase [bacterium]|nr:prolipoprotein diacylglyceryl transferase [bacterium]